MAHIGQGRHGRGHRRNMLMGGVTCYGIAPVDKYRGLEPGN